MARRLETYVPDNPHQTTYDWPFREIDHVLVRCDDAGPTLAITGCRRVFDRTPGIPSDHYGIAVDLDPLPRP